MNSLRQILLCRKHILFVVLLSLTVQTFAIDIVVTTNADDGNGSFRQAILVNAFLGGGNTILFSNTVTRPILLTSGELLIQDNVAIVGPGANALVISANLSNRVFNIGASTTVSISGLTIANGYAIQTQGGGGILSKGDLVLNGCALMGNICSGSSGLGGGINHVTGSLVISNCCFSGNSASYGAALAEPYTTNTLTLVNSTFAQNTAYVQGGGLYLAGGAVAITNCTFATNSAGSTAAGAIHNLGTNVTVFNSIIAGNGGRSDCEGNFISKGFNFIGNNAFSTGWGISGDRVGTAGSPIDPRLEALADNGSTTRSMSPSPGSPVIDQGNSGGITTDQRGRARPVPFVGTPPLGGDGSDIGAVEVQTGEFDPVVRNTGDSGLGSLRRALAVANFGDTILFTTAVTNVIKLTTGELATDKNITVSGPGAKVLTISGNNSNRVFHITGGIVNLSGLTIANGYADGGAGILAGAGSLNISQCQIISNTTPYLLGGGGIYVLTNASLVLSNSAVAFNQAYIIGGGIYMNGGQGAMWNCTVFGNELTDPPNGVLSPYGAGIVVYQGSFGITSSTISSNASTHTGGGIAVISSIVNIRNSIVAGNIAPNAAPDTFGAFNSGGYNLIGDTNGGSGFGSTGDQLNVNPLLAPFADYGGPTFTMALRGGSPAIDKGKDFGATIDQRGASRPFDFGTRTNAVGGDGSDIGAFEVGSPQLKIQPAPGNNVLLTWPSYYDEFTLESVTNLTTSGNWSSVAGTPVVVGNHFSMTNTATDVMKFYRLKDL